MADKVQKIREEIEKIKTAHSSVGLKESNPDVLVVQVCTNLLSFIDSLQEEPHQELYDKLSKLRDDAFSNTTKESWEACLSTIPDIVGEYFDEKLDSNIQYASREIGIKAHAEDYSFNIESELFQQLSKEQQKLWRKEIEQACISGGYCGLNIANDKRYDKKEPVSEDLEEAANQIVNKVIPPLAQKYKDGRYVGGIRDYFERKEFLDLVKAGAQWQKENLWKPADGDDMPEIDREVIVLINYNAQCNIHDEEYPTYRVGFGHRPNPNGWDGKNIDTNVITHYTPKLYDKGGWNAPNIVYWMDARLPYEENKIDKEIEP